MSLLGDHIPAESLETCSRALLLSHAPAPYSPHSVFQPQPAGFNETVLPLLDTLVMSHNPMGNLPGSLFQPLRTAPLKGLFLRNCSLSQFCKSPTRPVSVLLFTVSGAAIVYVLITDR